MKFLKKTVRLLAAATGLILTLASCSGDDYMKAIPANSEAIASFDTEQMQQQIASTLESALGIADIQSIGIDYGARLFAFQTKTGYYGLCAKMDDADKTEEFFKKQQTALKAQPLRKRSGFLLTSVQDKWVVGFSDDALLLLGPVAPKDIAVAQQQLVGFLKQEEISASNSRMLSTLDSIQSPLSLVARAQALPSGITAPFTLGVSDDARTGAMDKVYIRAGLTFKDDCVLIEGSSFSYDAKTNQLLQQARSVFRPVQGKYTASASSASAVSLVTNVDGKEFLPLLKRSGSAVGSLLTLLNTTIDFDKIIQSVDGDLCLQLHSALGEKSAFSLAAQLKDHTWLADLPYWQKSCPQGASLTEIGEGRYAYTSGSEGYCFGLTPDNQFYSGTTIAQAESSLKPSPTPLPKGICGQINGQPLVLIVNADRLLLANEAARSLASKMLGQTQTIVYILK